MLVISVGVGPGRLDPGLRLGDPRRRDQLLGLGDLLDRPGGADTSAQLAQCGCHVRLTYFFFGAGLRTFTDSLATSSGSSASASAVDDHRAAVGRGEALLEVVDDVDELVARSPRRASWSPGSPSGCRRALAFTCSRNSASNRRDVLDRNRVQVALGAEEDRDHLVLDRHRAVLRLLEQLDQPAHRAPAEPSTSASRSEAKAAKASSSRYCDRSRRSEPATSFIALIWAAPPTRDTDTPTLMAGRTPWLNRSDSRKHWPSVIEMTLVGMNAEMSLALVSMIGRPVIEPPPSSSDSLRAALQQPGVQVEHVTGVGLATRRAAQQQRDRAVGLGLLGQIVEHDQDVLAVVHPVLADGRTGVGRKPFEAGGVRRRGRDDGGVLHRAALLQRALHAGDRGALLADRDVHAAHLLLGIAGLPVLALVEDGVDADRGLAGLAVADDQLALAAADRGHARRWP